MSDLRDEIRAILREEIAALAAGSQADVPSRERVRIASSADLARFAQDLVARAADPDFSARVARGDVCFELAEHQPVCPPIASGPAKARADVLNTMIVTERDISALAGGARVVRIARASRLTPLARDEARRRGIRIERSET